MFHESYTLSVRDDHIIFNLREGEAPDAWFTGETGPEDYAIICRMGDPELMECVVWRRADKPGGIFQARSEDTYFIAEAPTNLAYALALSFFGQLVANARYGVDIFENLGETDD